jgi:carboxyl-terminal processing protease
MTKKKVAFLALSVALLLFLLGGALFGQASQKKDNGFRYISIFIEVFDLVRNNYVEPVPSDQLMDGAFSGVTDAIDEFSYYIPPAQMASYKSMADKLTDEDNGVGLIVTKRFGYGYVIAPVAGSPAAQAGIERGDFIEKVGGQPTQKMTVWQLRNAIRTGNPLQLQVLRGGQTKRDDFTIKPNAFHPVAITTQQFGRVAYIKVPFFEKGTAAQFRAALQNVHKAGSRQLIIDLRGNAGGSVEEAIAAADEVLTSGLITSLAGQKIEGRQWQADRETAYDGAIQVLQDNATAAGAEVFAAAIHGNGRGKTVGVTTFGKSVVQRLILLPSGGGVYMTVGHYTTPELKPIKDAGVKPDVVVDLTAQAIREPGTEQKTKPREDLILNKALQLFSETPAEKKAA